jgi:hypothetical protein
MRLRAALFTLCAAALAAAAPAYAGDTPDGWFAPLSTPVADGWTASLGVNLSGAAYATHQGGGVDPDGVQAFAVFAPSLVKDFADGWEVGVKGSVLAYHDHLSGDNYGNDVFELGYVYAQTPYGRVEIGQQNGVAYSQSVTAPVVDSPVAINDANVTFFKDPATGRAFNGIWNLRTGVFTSANYSKISYIAPRIAGLQLGVSYTPYQAKGFPPFLDGDHHIADRATNFLEGSANYTVQSGNWNVQAYTAIGTAHDAKPSAAHDDAWDWGAGVETDYSFDDSKLSLGTAYRISNAYTFDIQQAAPHGVTSNLDSSIVYTFGPWIAGVEYETGIADGVLGQPTLHENGWNPSVAYVVNSNLQLTLGWQTLHFRESARDFYNGKPSVGMDAVYLHANINI